MWRRLGDLFSASQRAANRFRVSVLIGLVCVAAVMAAAAGGWTTPVELILLDKRYQWFAAFNPPPDRRVVHVHIDDKALRTIGRWPWNRSELAVVNEELTRAGAKVIAYDLLLDNAQPYRYVKEELDFAARLIRDGISSPSNGSDDDADDSVDPDATVPPSGDKSDPGAVFRKIVDDALFAESMRQAGNVLLASSLATSTPLDDAMRRVMALLEQNVLLDMAGVDAAGLGLTGAQRRQAAESLATLKERVMRQKLLARMSDGQTPTLDECRAAILPGVEESVTNSLELGILREAYDQAVATMALRPFTRPATKADYRFGEAQGIMPAAPLAQAAAGAGSVTVTFDRDSKVRHVPLWLRENDRLHPHLSLVIACHMLDVKLPDVVIERNAVVLPNATMQDGSRRSIRVPMMSRRPGDDWELAEGICLVSWPTNRREWKNLYGGEGDEPPQYVPIGRLIELNRFRADVKTNERQVDGAVLGMATFASNTRFEPYRQVVLSLQAEELSEQGDAGLTAERDRMREAILKDAADFLSIFEGEPDENLSPTERLTRDELNRMMRVYHKVLDEELPRLRGKIAAAEREFREKVAGAACIIGWSAGGAIADFVPTSLIDKCPGPIVHGALVNAMLTDHFIARGPVWVDLLVVLLVGLAASLIAAKLAPVASLAATLALGGGYFAFNGSALFDYANVWVSAAGPIAAAAMAWTGITVFRLIAEQRDKARITGQFRNYVATDLVDLLVEDAGRILKGRHELTCMFTDIEGFTSLSNRLGAERTQKVLTPYLRVATETLMAHSAYVNKYLGDGIMAFWGAPVASTRYAIDACQSVIACFEALKKLADDPALAGLPVLRFRAGLATGPVMVDDFGAPPTRSDYTVIGDAANLASRLENANKQFGTSVLICGRTKELVDDLMLTSPIGRVVFVGRDDALPVYELLNSREAATPQQLEFVADHEKAVAAFQEARFDECLKLFNDIGMKHGHRNMINLYMIECRTMLDGTIPLDRFDGSITLTQK